MTNKGIKINAALQYQKDGIYWMSLKCYRRESNGSFDEIIVTLKRVLDTYYRYRPELEPVIGGLPRRSPEPIFLAFVIDARLRKAIQLESQNRHIYIDFPKDSFQCEVRNIKAVPNTYWNSDENSFSIQRLSRFQGFVRFSVASNLLEEYRFLDYEVNKEDELRIVLAFALSYNNELRVRLHSESSRDLQFYERSRNFINPFTNIESYPPLGDPISLSMMMFRGGETHRSSISPCSQRLKSVVSATVAQQSPDHFRIEITVEQRSQRTGRLRRSLTTAQDRTSHVDTE